MADLIYKRIQAALDNPALQAALDLNASRSREAHLGAYASLPEPWEVMRQRAHQMRSRVIADLDHYLEQFTGRLQANGVRLHWAHGAGDAAQIVLDIAARKGAKLVAKSKSMVSEEIDLNQALLSRGIQVVETDLGEYIVQLRGERPSHIIAPAVHLQRDQVGRTFHQKLGTPETSDVAALTATARQVLRQVFLDADIGISGVNFGVAETGTLCLVTNEGNGRMVTTLPKTHIALMGIERLVPTLDDLALMLYLLPRSATGQKITVYTSLIHGPRHPLDDDGPEERHLILVDNGRQAMRRSPLAEALLCIRCGACLNACPVFQEIGGHAYVSQRGESSPYPGPIGSIVSPGIFGREDFGHLARLSSLCGACREVCPVAIDLPTLLLRVRAGLVPEPTQAPPNRPIPPNPPTSILLGVMLYTWLATSPVRFARMQKFVGWVARFTPQWMRLPGFTGWGKSRDFPRPAESSFRARWLKRPAANSGSSPNGQSASASYLSKNHPQPHLRSSDDSITPSVTMKQSSLITRFQNELTALGGQFHLCTAEDLSGRLIAFFQGRRVARLAACSEDNFPPGLIQRLIDAHIEIQYQPDPTILVGLTGASAGLAETGSLLITSGRGRALAHSLLPEIHVVVLRANDILPRLPEVLKSPAVTASRSSVLVSGPSRTADIEMTLTIGVHGPGELHVFCLTESADDAD